MDVIKLDAINMHLSNSPIEHQIVGFFSHACCWPWTVSKKHGITPNNQHHTCMIDLFARTGHFDEAMMMIKKMPSSYYSPVWCALLSSCRKWGNWKLGRLAFEKAVQLNDTHGVAYMHMVNMYAATSMQKGWRKTKLISARGDES